MEDLPWLVSQVIVLLLLIASETLALTDSPYNGILHLVLQKITEKLDKEKK